MDPEHGIHLVMPDKRPYIEILRRRRVAITPMPRSIQDFSTALQIHTN